MGLLQQAIDTYDENIDLVGVYREGHIPLAPIGHTLTNANIEITLNAHGDFVTARKIEKDEPKILIPVTEESAGRTNQTVPPTHPLCDKLKYIANINMEAHKQYLEGLQNWARSDYAHPFLQIIYIYLKRDTVINDLITCGINQLDKAKNFDNDSMICWRVIGVDDEEPACWKNQNLLSAFTSYYCSQIAARKDVMCMIDGTMKTPAIQHPKGIISINGSAKLISSKDSCGFNYHGRFSEESQAATVSYIASQKAHNALRWLASEQGVSEFSGNRIFLCWNPKGISVPKPMRPMRNAASESVRKPSDYRQQLRSTMMSFRRNHQLKDTDIAVLVSFDAATTGRLAVTYYNEISIKTFLEHMQDWDEHCCWYAGQYGIQAPNLFTIAECAFGVQRKDKKDEFRLEVDDRVQRQHLQRLLDCKINGGVFPADIVKTLVQRASNPQDYEENIWRRIVHTACSVLQKYRFDTKQGGNEMSWELDKKDRSFQYGRLLAVMERAEADYYESIKETRQTNAVKFMSEYCQRPFYVFDRVNKQLCRAYLNRIKDWQRNRYERLVGEIFGILSEFPENELRKPLNDLYLMGYELQRNAFFEKKEYK